MVAKGGYEDYGGQYSESGLTDDDGDDSTEYFTIPSATSRSVTTPHTTPAPTPDTTVTYEWMLIIKTFSNGDRLILYPGPTAKETSRVCVPTPNPPASKVIDKHVKEHPSPEPTPSPDDSPDDSASAQALAGDSDSDSISYGTIDTSIWSETKRPYPTKPMSGSSLDGYGYASSSTPPAKGASPAPESQPTDGKEHHSHPPIGAVVVAPLVIILLLITAFAIWKRKRRNRAAAAVTSEMKMRSPEDGLPRYTPSAAPLMSPSSGAGGLTIAPTGSNSLAPTVSVVPTLTPVITGTQQESQQQQQPIILNSNMGGAYFTGIDTSDAVSLTSSTANAHGNGVAGNRMSFDARSMNSSDEPPPPYRPRSVPPISRETSLRVPNTGNNISQMLAPLSEGNLSQYDIDSSDGGFTVANGLRNPFESGNSPTASLGEGSHNPFDDAEVASVSSSGSSSAPVSPLVEEREQGHVEMGGRLGGEGSRQRI